MANNTLFFTKTAKKPFGRAYLCSPYKRQPYPAPWIPSKYVCGFQFYFNCLFLTAYERFTLPLGTVI